MNDARPSRRRAAALVLGAALLAAAGAVAQAPVENADEWIKQGREAGKKEVHRTDLPEDMRRLENRDPKKLTTQPQKKATLKKAKRKKATPKKVEQKKVK